MFALLASAWAAEPLVTPAREADLPAQPIVDVVRQKSCAGTGRVEVVIEARNGVVSSTSTPENVCLDRELAKVPPGDVVGTYTWVWDFDVATESTMLLAIIGTSGDAQGGRVEDLFADGGDWSALDEALREAEGVAVAGSIVVAEGPPGITYDYAVVKACEDQPSSNVQTRITLRYLEGRPHLDGVAPKSAFATCVAEGLTAQPKGALNAKVVLEVVGPH